MIKTQGAEQILKNSIHLHSLDLGKNFIKSSIGLFLKGYFDSNKLIKRLNLEMNELTAEGVKTLCKGVQNSKLASLNIKGNAIKDQGAIYLADLYDTGCSCLESLEELDISSNDITPEGFVHLGRMLAKSKLKNLNISKNLMGDEGLMMLVDTVEASENIILLNRLDISSCKVSDKVINYLTQGIIRLIEGLECMVELQHIRANDNYISDKHERVILELLTKNNTLISLGFNGNRMSLSCIKTIKKILDRNNK
jgi:Ran GTPase-activating protein (RanGAP) involved in mRNA processing and transport